MKKETLKRWFGLHFILILLVIISVLSNTEALREKETGLATYTGKVVNFSEEYIQPNVLHLSVYLMWVMYKKHEEGLKSIRK